MNYFLDTNVCIFSVKGRFPSIKERLERLTPEDIKIPSIVRAELLLGAKKSNNPEKALETIHRFLLPYEVLPFCAKAADIYADVRFALESKGTPVGPNDLIIASTAMAHNGTLITHNTKEFQRIRGLLSEDWVI